MAIKYYTVGGKLALSGGHAIWNSILLRVCNITAGDAYTIGIDKNGQVWSWGYNVYGQLGDNSLISKRTPVSIQGTKKTFCNITAGYYHTIGIDHDGQVWGWGYNNYGGLGDNSVTSRLTPVSIQGNKKTFCNITADYRHTIGIDKNGQVWGWGFNYRGQLGDNSIVSRLTPVSIQGTKKTFCNISAGREYTIGTDHDGQVWGWGYNNQGQLGDNTTLQKLIPVSIQGTKKTFCNIAAGYYHTIGIDHDGQVWSWGDNTYGQLGDNTNVSRCTPVSIQGTKKTFCNITAGFYHTIGIDYTGQVWGWGYNKYGQLGDNSVSSRLTPVSIQGVKKTFCNITAGNTHTIGIDYTGQVWGWGYNTYGQLGDNSVTNKCTPVSILGTKKTFCNINAGTNHSIGIDKNGQVWSWGSNSFGVLGDNTTVQKLTPVSIQGTKKTFCNIAAGQLHTIGLDKNGQVWSWGYNLYGQLGDNSVTNKCTPVSIQGAKKTFCNINAGQYYTIGIDNRGQVWGWGYNNRGPLGDNSIVSRCTPVSIQGTKKTFCNITAGNTHTIGIDFRGQVWGWGYNGRGQVGDNSVTSRRTPVSILGTKKTFCKISGGFRHTAGIDHDGQVWSWGDNTYGQLGDNSIVSKRTPVSIQGAKKTFCDISGSENYTIGIDYTGQVWSWGANNFGQLGDNSIVSRCAPLSIQGAKKTFCNINAGQYYTIGIDNRGQVWGWGNNSVGQLGNYNSATPLKVCNF